MKAYERESFIKTFGIFFLSLVLFTSLVAYFYDKEQTHSMDEQIFTRMKAFTYDFKALDFSVDVVPYTPDVDEFNIEPCDEGVCGYFRIESAQQSMFKVILSKQVYERMRQEVLHKVLVLYALVVIAIFAFALFYSFYALYPLKKALSMMEEFLKDVVHDLNTPVTSILLNVKALKKKSSSEELERIELGAKTIASLYHNLEVLHRGFVPQKSKIELETLLHVRASTYQKLYSNLTFSFQTHPYTIYSDYDALSRILDNVISNACKYNHKKGSITLSNENNIIRIQDTGVGIKRCDAVFERYYKESARGLGLGLHIVKTLCDALGIAIHIQSEEGIGTTVRLSCPKGEEE